MRQKKEKEIPSVLTERMDVGSGEVDKFQALLLKEARSRSPERQLKVELMALTFMMEDYLKTEPSSITLVGEFLKTFLKTLNIKQNKFANYIGLKPSNLSKLLSGERSLNYEIASILGVIFQNDAMLWLDIQDKNNLIKLRNEKGEDLKRYSLMDLVDL